MLPPWEWKNLRAIGLKIEIWPWPWSFEIVPPDADCFGGEMGVHVGPFYFGIAFNNGGRTLDEMGRL